MATSDTHETTIDEDVQFEQNNQCHECDGQETTNAVETVCEDCGLVINEDRIDRGPDVEEQATGTVQDYNDDRGFGFVTTADVTQALSVDEDSTVFVFFHISELDTTWIEEGDRLRFETVEGEKACGMNVERSSNATVITTSTIPPKTNRSDWGCSNTMIRSRSREVPSDREDYREFQR